MKQILDEYEEDKIRHDYELRSKFISWSKYAIVFFVFIVFSIYIGNILYGRSSLDVLLNLQENKANLLYGVKSLKSQNAKLQKEYFELRQLDPDTY